METYPSNPPSHHPADPTVSLSQCAPQESLLLARSGPCARGYSAGWQPKPFGVFLTHFGPFVVAVLRPSGAMPDVRSSFGSSGNAAVQRRTLSANIGSAECAQPMGSEAARRAATSASSRSVSRRNWVFSQEAIVKPGRAANRRLAVCFASSGWPFS
jgi:hypothetical protein